MSDIIPQATYKKINDALASIIRLRLILEKLERCGQECQDRMDELDKMEAYFNGVKREFFPDKP